MYSTFCYGHLLISKEKSSIFFLYILILIKISKKKFTIVKVTIPYQCIKNI